MSALVIALVSLLLLLAMSRTLPSNERAIFVAAWASRLLAAFGQISITRLVYGGGDMLAFDRQGQYLVDLMHADLGTYGPAVVQLLLQLPNDLPVAIKGVSTSSMFAVSALLHWALGPSLFAHCTALAMMALLGMAVGWLALRERIPETWRVRVSVAYLLMPSVVFWTAGVLKESVAMGFLGLMLWAALRIAQGRLALPVPVLAVAGWVVSLFKAYLLFPLAIGWLAAWYVQRGAAQGGVTLRPMRLLMALVLAWAMVVGLGRLFPRYAIDTLDEEVDRLQTIGGRLDAGSNFGAGAGAGTGGAALWQAPLAVVTTLARPFPFEARNALALVASAEITFVVVALFLGIRRRGAQVVLKRILRDPFAAFAVTAVLVGAVGIGLATTNMGTLSRYRMPVLPWYAVFALGIVWFEERRADAPAPAVVTSTAPPAGAARVVRTPAPAFVVRSKFTQTLDPPSAARAEGMHIPRPPTGETRIEEAP